MAQPFSKILLSGASGMLGSALQQVLTQRNQPILQLVRHAPILPSQLQWNPNLAQPIPDTSSLENLRAAIHLSGANVAGHRWTRAYKRAIFTSRVDSTRALATALAHLNNPPPTLVVASATGFYGNRGDEILDESSAPGTGFLADLCQQWEAATQPAVDAGIRVISLRFGVILGPSDGPGSDGALARMLPIFRLGLGGPLGSGQQWISWVSLDDVIAAILFAIDSGSAFSAGTLSGPINVVSPNPVTNTEFTHALGKAVHRPAILPAPAFALRLALGEMADETLLASARVLPAKLTAAEFQFSHPTLAQALDAALASTPKPVAVLT